ncbi:MAG: hypothetical protein CMM01_23995 [Rhodopirellula sp.]|nr:hypothetical protein [Rhodopirellula sp.]
MLTSDQAPGIALHSTRCLSLGGLGESSLCNPKTLTTNRLVVIPAAATDFLAAVKLKRILIEAVVVLWPGA